MAIGTDFGLTHAAYRQYRPPYPAALYERIFALAPGRALALDLGAGTGLVSAVLGRHFERVIAVEPDPAMAAHLRETAPNAELLHTRAEQLELPDACADLITCANAYHWMDGTIVPAKIASVLRPGGVFAGWRYPMPTLPGPLQALAVRELQQRWAKFWDPRSGDLHSMRRDFAAQPELELVVTEQVPNPIEMSSDAILGFLRSTSFASAYLRTLADDAAARYLAALAAELREIMADSVLAIDFELTLVVARRRA